MSSPPHVFFKGMVLFIFLSFDPRGGFFVFTYSFLLWQEFEILSQIRQLQASCSQYSLPVNPRITSWVQAHTLLTDQERWDACLQTTYRENIHLKIKPITTGFFFLPFFKLYCSFWSYELSRELEPPIDPCPSSPNSWSSRILSRKKFVL